MRARVPRLLDTRAREGPQGVRSQIPGSKPAAFRFPSVSIQHETFNYYRNYISLFDVIGFHSPMINPMSTNVGSLGGAGQHIKHIIHPAGGQCFFSLWPWICSASHQMPRGHCKRGLANGKWVWGAAVGSCGKHRNNMPGIEHISLYMMKRHNRN